MKNTVNIFVSHRIDKNSVTVGNPLFVPVRCGATYDKRDSVNMLGDDTGENISSRRMTFNELTVQYWAWKNSKADYIGLCHYRRYMVFSSRELQADPYGNVLFDNLDQNSCMDCGLLDQKSIEKKIRKYDILISQPYDVTYRGFHSLYEHYAETPLQHVQDMRVALDVIAEISPAYLESAMKYFNGTLFYPCNLFVMKREIFDEYCQWLFPILFALEQCIDISSYSEEEQRVFGLLGERLLGVFFLDYVKKNPQCKYAVLQRALFWNTETSEYIAPINSSSTATLKAFAKRHLNPNGKVYKFLKTISSRIKK